MAAVYACGCATVPPETCSLPAAMHASPERRSGDDLRFFTQPPEMSSPLSYRPAYPADAEACVALRGQTRQNAVSRERLAELGITPASWAEDTRSGRLPGHVCVNGEQLVGYCFGDAASGEIVVLALLPDYEGRGIGRHLLGLMVQTLRAAGHQRLFLGCARDPATRSHGFYRHLGWRPTGEFDALGDEVLELTLNVSTSGG